ncbi:MAG TPA: hypothetical protein ENF52_01370 [Chloroflexi bacterium]|nr:hypothetical protein [Chloroflexota bacterium]
MRTLVGETLGKYEVIELLGSGGMAEVYKAYHPSLDRYVAVKVLHHFLADEENFLTRFQREAKIIASFRHPNIVQVYDFDYDAKHQAYYIVMEYLDGQSLKTVLQQGTSIPLEEAIHIVTSVANALQYAHRHGMVHRDVKPANIIITGDGQVVLSDFGIAKIVNTDTLTASGALIGTPAYMAPEQGIGQAGDERSDIYSLGVVFYQLVTGSLPFEADTPLGIVLKHISCPLPPPTSLRPDLPPGVEAVLMKALAKGPNNRYQTAQELIADLQKISAGEPVAGPSPQASALSEADLFLPVTHQPPISTEHKPVWLSSGRIVLILVLLVVIISGGFLLQKRTWPIPFITPLTTISPTFSPTVTEFATSTPTPDLTATFAANATQFVGWIATYEATTGVTPTPSTTPTPDRTATAVAACVFDMTVIEDPPVWPAILQPNQKFTKYWTVENTGTCPWPAGAEVTFSSGYSITAITLPAIPPLQPGETAELQMTLRAPDQYADYIASWQIRDANRGAIGEPLKVMCYVGPTPTPRPTDTPTPTPTPVASPTPSEPLHFSVPTVVEWHTLPNGNWWARAGITAWGGTGEYRYYLNVISDETEFFNGTFEIEWGHCQAWWGSIYVVSGDETAKWEGNIPYPDPSRCQ